MTWVSGMCLLTIVYYFNARAYLIEPALADLTPLTASAIGLAAIVASWFIYDLLCKSPLRHRPMLLAGVLFLYLLALAIGLSLVFSGRGAYIHVGAAIGTIMVANVFLSLFRRSVSWWRRWWKIAPPIHSPAKTACCVRDTIIT